MHRDGYPLRRIDEAGAVDGGRQRSPHVTGTMRPYLRVANVLDGFIDTSDVLSMPFEDEEYERFKLQSGDILLNEGQSLALVGRAAVYRGEPEDCAFQNTLIRFRAHEQTDVDFTYFLFRYLQYTGQFAAIAVKTTSIAHLGTQRFASMRVPWPPLEEQRAIGRVLGTWDYAEHSIRRLLKLKRHRKNSLMQQLLRGRRRFPEFIGKPWRTVHIGDILSEVKRTVKLDADTAYRLVSIRRRSGGFFDREVRLGQQIGYPTLEELQSGDFVIARRQVLHGAMATVPPAFDGAFVSNAYAILAPCDPSELHVPFFNFLSQQPRMYHLAYRCSYGVAIEKMFFRLDWFLKELVSIPPTLAEQQRIAAVLTAADREIGLLEAELALLREQKKGLMQKLLTGTVRVHV